MDAVIWLTLYGVLSLVAIVGRLLEWRASRPREEPPPKRGPFWWERL